MPELQMKSLTLELMKDQRLYRPPNEAAELTFIELLEELELSF